MNNGGPAFPLITKGTDGVGCEIQLIEEGMSLRDYFAAKAMQGLLAKMDDTMPGITKNAYKMADVMLVEGEK